MHGGRIVEAGAVQGAQRAGDPGRGHAQGLENSRGRRAVIGHDGAESDFAGVPLIMFDLPNPGEVVFTANNVYQRRPEDSVPALQVVYGDLEGRMPWEPGYDLEPDRQPWPGSFRA